MKCLFIGAHPDDIEFSCGGTILRLVEEGHEVYIAIMTNGGAAQNSDIQERVEEQKKAAAFLGAKELYLLGCMDGGITVDGYTISYVGELISKIYPDIVFTHSPTDSHQDHRNTAEIVKSATRRRCSLLYFDSYSSVDFKPNLYVDISRYLGRKAELLSIFKSQVKKYKAREIDFIELAFLRTRLNGCESGAYCAEGFAIDNYKI